MGAALIPNLEVSEMLVNASIQSQKNKEILKSQDKDLANLAEGIVNDTRGFDLFKWVNHFEPIRGYIQDRFGEGATGQMAITAMQKGITDLALQYLVAGTYDDAEDAASAAAEAVKKGLGDEMVFSDRKTIQTPQNPLNGPRMELLGEVLRDKNFLRQRVYPEIGPHASIQNLMSVTGKTREEVLDRWFSPSNWDRILDWMFSDTDTVTWKQSFEGIYPVIPNQRIPDLSSRIYTHKGTPFIIPYDELPPMIVKDY